MTSETPASPNVVPEMDAAELARHGITLVRTERYHIGPYRYGSLADAIAEAKSGRMPGNDR